MVILRFIYKISFIFIFGAMLGFAFSVQSIGGVILSLIGIFILLKGGL